MVNVPAASQDLQKKMMDHSVYQEWNTIKSPKISNDGEWIIYELNREDGDGSMKIYQVKNGATISIERGQQSRISEDSRFVSCLIAPAVDSIKAMKRRKVKEKDLPKDTLLIYDLQQNSLTRIPNVKSFEFPQKWSGWLAYQMEMIKQEPQIDSSTIKPDTITIFKIKKETKDSGTKFVMHHLPTGEETVYPFVKDYKLSEEGGKIIFTSTGDEADFAEGVYQYDCNQKKLTEIFLHKGKYKKLTIDKSGKQMAFIADLDTTKNQIRPYQLFYYDGSSKEAGLLAAPGDSFLPDQWNVSADYQPYFSENGERLFLGIAAPPILQDTTLLEEEIVQVEVWSNTDTRLHTQQKVDLEKDKKKSYIVSWDTRSGQFTQLSQPDIPNITIGNEGKSNYALGYNDDPYLSSISWEGFPSYKDVFLVDMKKGTTKKIGSKLRCSPRLSPEGKYAYWYSYPDTAWYAYSVQENQLKKITNNHQVPFYNELHDTPSLPGSYGIGGWLENDASVLIYDRYDIWEMDPSGKKPAKLLTNGREDNISYRYIKLDPEARHIPKKEDLLLYAFDQKTKDSGYSLLSLKSNKVKQRVMSNKQFTRSPMKARDSKRMVFTRENFETFPDLWYFNGNFRRAKRVSKANPQQSEYGWGSIELIGWKGPKGKKYTGMLAKPAGFDPAKKYPMIVNFYERSSDRLNRHRAPYPHRSTIDYSFYTNRGYLIFNPDVPYSDGHPGQSAYDAVVSGTKDLIKKGFVDKDRIGLQGHSWGGYQVAHIITRTHMFKCVESGAPVVNMFSAYGGIRWGSGLSRMFQYEHTQSRIGATIWEKPELYKENSPLFFLDKVETPVLILHNDKDGAVPWYQGIEFFVGLRRLGKPAWLLNYNGEPHWPMKRQNRLDFNRRMQQFFDHYLKDAEKPGWMERGVPALETGILQGF